MARDIETRLRALEERTAAFNPTTTLTMPDGSSVRVPLRAPLDVLLEMDEAAREKRAPSHRYLDVVMRAVAESDGGSLCALAQAEQRSRELLHYVYPNGAEPAGGGDDGDTAS